MKKHDNDRETKIVTTLVVKMMENKLLQRKSGSNNREESSVGVKFVHQTRDKETTLNLFIFRFIHAFELRLCYDCHLLSRYIFSVFFDKLDTFHRTLSETRPNDFKPLIQPRFTCFNVVSRCADVVTIYFSFYKEEELLASHDQCIKIVYREFKNI